MKIEAGKYYRGTEDGAKLIAVEELNPHLQLWRFYRLDVPDNKYSEYLPVRDPETVEPWTEPKKLVPHWPVVLKDGAVFELGFGLYATVEQARIQYASEEGVIRLATELPPIMLEAPE